MTDILYALGILASGMIASAILTRWSPCSLAAALSAIGVAGILCLRAAVSGLLPTAAPAALRITWALPLGSVHLGIDSLSAWFLLPIGIVSLAAAIYSWGYFRGGAVPIGAAGPLMCLLMAGMTLSVSATDVVVFLVGWELMSLSAFFLVGFHHRDPEARHGAWMYLVATHLGTAAGVLPVLSAFVARSGSTSFETFSGVFTGSAPWVVSTVFFLGLVGFGTKAGLMPMHVWLPAAHPVAPSPVSALMSGVVIKTGIYGLLRTLTWLPPLPAGCAFTLITVGAVTGVAGILYALPQRQYKRMLAYSSIENMGIVAMGIGLGAFGRTMNHPGIAALGFGGAILHVLNHSLFKGLLFLSAGALLHGTGTGDIERLGGVARRDPVNAILFLIGSAAICALPPLNGFVSEYLFYSGFAESLSNESLTVAATGSVAIAALALIGGLSLSGFSKLFGVIFLGEPRDSRIQAHKASVSMLIGMGVLAIGCAFVALGAPMIGSLLSAPVNHLLGAAPGSNRHMGSLLESLASASRLFFVLLIVICVLVALRLGLIRSRLASPSQPTWGCGFAQPSARMQYTGSSYTWKLAQSFRSIVRTRRADSTSRTSFAAPTHLKTETIDAAVRFGFRPLFVAIARSCEWLRSLQQGRIQLYLVYIVVTVVIVFAIELGFRGASR